MEKNKKNPRKNPHKTLKSDQLLLATGRTEFSPWKYFFPIFFRLFHCTILHLYLSLALKSVFWPCVEYDDQFVIYMCVCMYAIYMYVCDICVYICMYVICDIITESTHTYI